MKEVMSWTGAGQIGLAIARRIGFGKKMIVGAVLFSFMGLLGVIMFKKDNKEVNAVVSAS